MTLKAEISKRQSNVGAPGGIVSESENPELKVIHDTLLDFLDSSDYCDNSLLLKRLENTNLFDAQVLLFSKSRSHYDALRILV
jgi:hypothetical protein